MNLQRWQKPILIVIGVAFSMMLYAALKGRIYVLHIRDSFVLMGIVLLGVLLAIFVSRVIAMRKQRTGRVLLACVVLGMGALSYGLFASMPIASHRDTLTFDGHVYQLAGRFVSYTVDERTLLDHMDYYWEGWLYRCELSGLFCDLVGEFTMRESSRLRLRDAALEVRAGNGRVTFTYTP